jgi:hypothetical protein
MDYYGPAFLAIACTYVVWSVFRYMHEHCRRRSHLAEIAHSLKEINERLKATPFEAVCLCNVCVNGKGGGSRRGSIAAAQQKFEAHGTPEEVAIGIQNGDSDT